MIEANNTLGVVLAGGLSRRMEGNEKSLLELKGKPLISHVVDKLQSQTQELIINANGEAQRFDFLDLTVQADTVKGFAGPLAGVLAGMTWATQNRPEITHIITAAADTPFFPDAYAQQMVSHANKHEAQIALAGSNDRHHPVFGLWPVILKDALHHFLVDEENRKVMLFVQRYANCRVDFEGGIIDPFFNVNTPDDLIRAEEYLRVEN